MKREPVILIGLLGAAIIAVLEAVGSDLLPPGMTEEAVRLTQAIVAIVTIVLQRSRVSPV
jgi:hypothetical protein